MTGRPGVGPSFDGEAGPKRLVDSLRSKVGEAPNLEVVTGARS